MNQQNWQKIMTSDAAALLDVLLKHEDGRMTTDM